MSSYLASIAILFRPPQITCSQRCISVSRHLGKRTTNQPALGYADVSPEDSKDSNRKYIYGPLSETAFKPVRHPLNALEQMTIGDYHVQNMDDPRYARSTVDILQDDSQLVVIHSYNNIGFQLSDGRFLAGPICVFPRLALSWKVLAPEEIDEDCVQLLTLLAPKPDVVVVGCGEHKNVDGVRSRLAPFFENHKLGYEILPVDQAAFTFNFLCSENRLVVGLLFPMIDIPDESWRSEELIGKQQRILLNRDPGNLDWVKNIVETPVDAAAAFGLIEKIDPEKPKSLPQKIQKRMPQKLTASKRKKPWSLSSNEKALDDK